MLEAVQHIKLSIEKFSDFIVTSISLIALVWFLNLLHTMLKPKDKI